jgi:MinD-like ATPase involved in chromosome partitioning or flagellar assembly
MIPGAGQTADMTSTRLEPAVCVGSSQRPWVTELINHVSDHGGMRVVGTALTQDDAFRRSFDVLLVDDVSSVMSPRFVSRMRNTGRLVIAIYDVERGDEARERVLGFGVDAVVPSTVGPAELVRVVVDTARLHAIDAELADLSSGEASSGPSPSRRSDAARQTPATGNIVVVLGGDGVTEVAVGLADAMVGSGASTVLVDLDTVEPSIAQRLGLPLTPNVFTATEHLRLRASLDGAFEVSPHGFATIAGIPNPREWAALSETEAADLVGELAGGFATVLVKVSRGLEDLSGFAGTVGRHDVARRLVAMADRVVAVSSASPVGAARLVGLAGDVRALTSVPIHVVVNQSPSSRFVHGELATELERSLSPATLTFLPTDSRVRKASWQGEVVRRGGFVRRLRPLAGSVGSMAVATAMPTGPEPVSVAEGSR